MFSLRLGRGGGQGAHLIVPIPCPPPLSPRDITRRTSQCHATVEEESAKRQVPCELTAPPIFANRRCDDARRHLPILEFSSAEQLLSQHNPLPLEEDDCYAGKVAEEHDGSDMAEIPAEIDFF